MTFCAFSYYLQLGISVTVSLGDSERTPLRTRAPHTRTVFGFKKTSEFQCRIAF